MKVQFIRSPYKGGYMKSLIILTTVLFLGISANAKGASLTLSQLEDKLVSYFDSMGSDQPAVFQGELDDIGGECTVSFVKQEDQSLLITLTGEGSLSLSFKVMADDPIRFKEKTATDSSFMNKYRIGSYGARVLTIIHVDDAYDTVSVQVGTTNLTCGAYY
jgi:hypothetical protein